MILPCSGWAFLKDFKGYKIIVKKNNPSQPRIRCFDLPLHPNLLKQNILNLNQAYQLIFESSPVAGILTDKAGKIILANIKAEKLFGYQEAMTGEQIALIVPDNSRENDYECTAVRKNGTTFPAEVHVSAFESDDTSLIYRTITDLSDNKKLIAKLQERVKEQRTLLQVTELLFKAKNRKNIFNESVDIIRSGWQYPDHTQVCIRLNDGSEFSTPGFKETPWKMSSVIHLNGQTYGLITVCYTIAFPESDDTGSVFMKEEEHLIEALAKLFSIFLHQLSSVKKLRENQALISKVTSLSPVNTYQFELDQDGKVRFLFASRGISFSNFNFSPDEIIKDSENLLRLIHPDDRERFDAALKTAYENQTDINIQYRVLIGTSVSWRWLRATSEKNDEEKVIWYGSTQDLTKIVEYIEVLEEILFDISHVMRKPVSTMLGLTDYLIVHDNMSEDTIKDFAKHLQTVAKEMDDYIKTLNDAYQQKRQSMATDNNASYSELLLLSKNLKDKSKTS
jgi:PAS domain-containing protein